MSKSSGVSCGDWDRQVASARRSPACRGRAGEHGAEPLAADRPTRRSGPHRPARRRRPRRGRRVLRDGEPTVQGRDGARARRSTARWRRRRLWNCTAADRVAGITSSVTNSRVGLQQFASRSDDRRRRRPRRRASSKPCDSASSIARRHESGSSSSSESHSCSATRRPIAASSTDRCAPVRWAAACHSQITPHLRVFEHQPPMEGVARRRP